MRCKPSASNTSPGGRAPGLHERQRGAAVAIAHAKQHRPRLVAKRQWLARRFGASRSLPMVSESVWKPAPARVTEARR
jgi:hypothetical protein